jgi:hypothetical protein
MQLSLYSKSRFTDFCTTNSMGHTWASKGLFPRQDSQFYVGDTQNLLTNARLTRLRPLSLISPELNNNLKKKISMFAIFPSFFRKSRAPNAWFPFLCWRPRKQSAWKKIAQLSRNPPSPSEARSLITVHISSPYSTPFETNPHKHTPFL